MADILQEKLTNLLQQTAEAHHKYESEELKGVRDEQWPAWYADFLLTNGLDGLLGSQADADEIALALEEITKRQKSEANQEPWPGFTARQLLEIFA